MIIRTGDIAKGMFKEAYKHRDHYADPLVYDYMLDRGAVLIRRKSKECLYIKTGGYGCDYSIALQGRPEEFFEHREQLERSFLEMEIVDWREIEEMVKWAPNVPSL